MPSSQEPLELLVAQTPPVTLVTPDRQILSEVAKWVNAESPNDPNSYLALDSVRSITTAVGPFLEVELGIETEAARISVVEQALASLRDRSSVHTAIFYYILVRLAAKEHLFTASDKDDTSYLLQTSANRRFLGDSIDDFERGETIILDEI